MCDDPSDDPRADVSGLPACPGEIPPCMVFRVFSQNNVNSPWQLFSIRFPTGRNLQQYFIYGKWRKKIPAKNLKIETPSPKVK